MPRAKYGIVGHRNNANIGDDIQVYATKLLLPSFDYLVDREHIDSFRSKDGEPVAMITSAWWTWRKWNWPIADCIIPHFIGFHYADHERAMQPGSPIGYESLSGEGMKYLKAYEPIGCRDNFTTETLQSMGVNAYFSGCITLTLPKMPKKDLGKYICVVSMPADVTAKIKDMMKDSGIEVRVFNHKRDRDPDMPWSEREKFIKERLTIYQNAVCVVTRKLHCALPCLAMEVPVFLVKNVKDIRFYPYYDWMHHCTIKEFLAGKFEYDMKNPPANPTDYLPTREGLINSVKEFVSRVEGAGDHAEKLLRYKHNEKKFILWQTPMLEQTMAKWIQKLKDNLSEIYELQNEYRELLEKNGLYTKTVAIAEVKPPMDLMEPDIEKDFRYNLTSARFLKCGNIDYEYKKKFFKGKAYNEAKRNNERLRNAFDVMLEFTRDQKFEKSLLKDALAALKKDPGKEPEEIKKVLEKLAKYRRMQKKLLKGTSLKLRPDFNDNDDFFARDDE